MFLVAYVTFATCSLVLGELFANQGAELTPFAVVEGVKSSIQCGTVCSQTQECYAFHHNDVSWSLSVGGLTSLDGDSKKGGKSNWVMKTLRTIVSRKPGKFSSMQFHVIIIIPYFL